MNDPINHPTHYTSHPSGVEPITITKHMNFCLGNVIKYVMRAGYKGNRLEDLKKAQYYLNLEISELESKIVNSLKELDDNYPAIESVNNEMIRKLQEAGVNVMPNGIFEATEENIKIYNEISGEKLAYKARINAQYKPEVWSNQKAIKDTSDPSGEPFLTDLCKVIESERSKNGI